MKLSFSLPPKSRSRVRPISDIEEGNLKEYVTEFDPSKTLTDAKPRYVIPPIENRWRPSKLLKNIHSGIEFEAEIPSEVSDKTTYGLNLRQDKPDLKPEPGEQMLLITSIRKDLESLPDAPDLEDFESVPVEGFGAALLAGYGWKPGQGIGRLKAKEDVPIVEYKKWIDNQGFGFSMDKASVKGTNAIGRKITTSRQIVANVEKIGSGSRTSTKRDIDQTARDKPTSWLRRNIRVRVISKNVKGGRFYLKKAVVTHVHGPTTCDITMDETQELVQGINQELLETALPRRGGHVLVLSGRHKGIYASLVEKDLDEETGVVCDAHSKEMLRVKFEQVAEYMGDPAAIGY